MHVPGGNNPDSAAANGKSYMQQPPFASLSQSVKTLLCIAVFQVIKHNKRFIQKHLLCFSRRNSMFNIFTLVATVPFKTGYLVKWPHHSSLYIAKIYTKE